MFWPLLSTVLRLSPTLIIELFVGQRVAPLSHCFQNIWFVQGTSRRNKIYFLNTWLVRRRGSGWSGAHGAFSRHWFFAAGGGLNLTLSVSRRDVLCVLVVQKPYGRNTIISFPWNQFECWPLQWCNYLGHADTFFLLSSLNMCTLFWAPAKAIKKNTPGSLCSLYCTLCSHTTAIITIHIYTVKTTSI